MMRLHRTNHGGFSLIEVICVVAITSILLGAILGLANATIRAMRGTREAIRQTRVTTGIARLMRRDYEGAFRMRGKQIVTLRGGRAAFDNESDAFLEFYTTTSLARKGRVPETGLSRVSYSLRPSTRWEDRVELVRTEQPYDIAQGLVGTVESEALTDGIAGCRVLFHTGSEWRDEWKLQILPTCMRIALAFEVDGSIEMYSAPCVFAPLVDLQADPLTME